MFRQTGKHGRMTGSLSANLKSPSHLAGCYLQPATCNLQPSTFYLLPSTNSIPRSGLEHLQVRTEEGIDRFIVDDYFAKESEVQVVTR